MNSTVLAAVFIAAIGVLFAFVVFGFIANIVIGVKDKVEGKTDDVFGNIKKAAEHLKTEKKG